MTKQGVNVPTPPILHILWHDDELDGPRSDYVAPWRRWFERSATTLGAMVTCTATLKALAEALATPAGRFDLLVMDVMLKRERETTFSALGFAQESMLRLDAGAQIAGLLRNRDFDALRPPWLERFARTPVVLLTSTPTIAELVRAYVDIDRRDGVVGIVKSTEFTGPEVNVGVEFDKRMRGIVGRLAEQARQSAP